MIRAQVSSHALIEFPPGVLKNRLYLIKKNLIIYLNSGNNSTIE